MPALRVLYVYADTVSGQEGLTDLVQLERAQFELCQETELSVISGLAQLENLEISGILGKHVLSEMGFVSGHTSLKYLDLTTNSITDVNPLSGQQNLRVLALRYNEGLSDFSPLSDLSELRTSQYTGD